ncbi:hypothetical protein V8G54_009065, partial [Vigna mungo]
KPVTVARRVGTAGEESSEGVVGRWVTWPKRRPWMAEGEVEKRWMREASVGPEIAIFCNGGSSMAALRESGENNGSLFTTERSCVRFTLPVESLETAIRRHFPVL